MSNIPVAIDPMGSADIPLPAGYRRVEWISSDPADGAVYASTTAYGGAPYVVASDTMGGKEPDGDFTWQIDMMHRGFLYGTFGGMGVRRTEGTTYYTQQFRFDISVTATSVVFNMGANKTLPSGEQKVPGTLHVIPGGMLDKRRVLTMSYTDNRINYTTVDGVIYDQNIDIVSPDWYPASGHYLRVGIRYNFGVSINQCCPHYIRIYSTKTWRNGELVSHYVPCVRISDGVAGLCNVVTGNFAAPVQGTFAYPS